MIIEKKVSIVIPVRVINDDLKESIKYLKKLNYKNYEVLIFSDSEDLPKKYNLTNRFKIIPTGQVGPAQKRNLAIKFASGEFIAFLDDDAYPVKDWLKVAIKNFDEEKICAVGGPSVTPSNESFLKRVSGEIFASRLVGFGTVDRYVPGKRRFVDDFPTVNLIVRAGDFKKIKGFDPKFWPGEDTKLCLDLIKKTKKQIVYDPKVLVYHHRREFLKPHLKQVSRYGMHRGQFARIFPENSRKLPYFIPTLFFIGLLLGPILSLTNNVFKLFYQASLILYFVWLGFDTIRVIFKSKDLRYLYYFPIGVFSTHIVYGVCFLYGLFKKPKLNLKAIDSETGRYIEG